MSVTNRKIESKAYNIGEVLRRPVFYKVPVYQRDFAWTSEQIDALLDDIFNALEDDRTEYFLGAMVVSQTENEKRLDIVDGQQRITAISMLFAAIATMWIELHDERRALGVERDFLGSEDRRTGDKIPKVTLNGINNPMFQKVVINGQDPDTDKKLWNYSNKLLNDAYSKIKNRISELTNKAQDKVSFLLELEEFIAEKVYLIVIEAGDESDAFTTFETLNDRGLDLAIADLVKNFLFSKAGSHIDAFKQYWNEINLLVGGDSLTQFLRYFWNAHYETARESDLYKSIKRVIKNNVAARSMIERLRRAADLYAALSNPEHSYWGDFHNHYKKHLEALALFKVTQYRPIALAAMEKFDPDKMISLLRMLSIFSFRYTVVSALNTGNLDKIYSKTALSITNDKLKGPKEVFESLRTVYVDDDRFEADFQQKLFTKEDVARYVLREINSQIERDNERMASDIEGRLTLEHILPKNPQQGWEGCIPEGKEPAEVVYRIGNLTLLEKGKNRGIGNSDFHHKKEIAYKASTLAINHALTRNSTWTLNQIEERCSNFALIAKKIWRIDF